MDHYVSYNFCFLKNLIEEIKGLEKMKYLLLVFVFLSFGCSKKEFVEGKYFAGGKYVSAKTLNKGKLIYTEYCMPCHGVKGDGKGVAAKGMQVPPRNFTTGIFKFGRVLSGELPHDKHFKEILTKGLNGTAMLPWDMEDGAMEAVIQYIKTFAPEVWEGKDKELGAEINPSKDPFGLAHKSAAIKKGKEIYHMVANCQSCHRAYATKQELNAWAPKYDEDPTPMDEFDEDMYKIKRQETEWGFQNVPPEFTWNNVRSARTVPELYVRLAAGVGGTSMPAWKDTLSDEEIWAVAYYVKSLMELKDRPEREILMSELK